MIGDNLVSFINTVFILLKPVLITVAITAVISVGFVTAVYFYNKSRNVKEKSSVYFLIFLFGIIGAVVYFLSTRKKAENIEYTGDKKKYKIISVILAVICVAATAVNVSGVLSDDVYSDDYSELIDRLSVGCYDRYGVSHSTPDDIIYYTTDGYEFRFTTDSNGNAVFSQLSSSYDGRYKEEYEADFAYIDKEGYLVITNKALEIDDNVDGAFRYVDSSNEYYASAIDIYWDEDGNLCEF